MGKADKDMQVHRMLADSLELATEVRDGARGEPGGREWALVVTKLEEAIMWRQKATWRGERGG